jgi:isohexenylglutaconyl-CoA hydratase
MTNLPKTERIDLNLKNGWLTISLNHPETKNALSQQLTNDIILTLTTVKDDFSIRGITLRGEGGVFCAGGDLKSFKTGFQGKDSNLDDIVKMSEATGQFFELINSMPKPVIMLAEGAAMAGGLGMLCAGDVVVVTEDCKFALTETSIGIPPAQIAPFIVERIGLAKARQIMLTGARFTGKEAYEMGIADYLAKDPEELRIIEANIIKGVMRCAPEANAVTKKIVLATRSMERSELIKFAAEGFANQMVSDEGREGISSFIEKRKPKWTE